MDDTNTALMSIALVVSIILSAFFSASETAMMSINRYRLRHLAKNKDPAAMRTAALLDRPDRLIGLILLGNNFVNILATSLSTVLAIKLYGEAGVAIAAVGMTIVMMTFGEVTPKTLAALHPQPIAFLAAYVLTPMLKIFYPLVWCLSALSNAMLSAVGVKPKGGAMQQLSQDELRSVVKEAGALIPHRHRQMLLGILDLEKATVEDIMIPRNEIIGIDLDTDMSQILAMLTTTQYTRLPVYRTDIDNVIGVLHVRTILRQLTAGELTKELLAKLAREPFYIPEGTALNSLLLTFQRQRRRIGLVVDEYGEIHGLVTLDDILEEIVGDFTTDASTAVPDVIPEADGAFLVAGNTYIRDINRAMNWHLPTHGPKTLNGIVIEHLESIPEAGTSVLIAGYPIEILQTAENTVKMARIRPRITTDGEGI